VEREIQQSLVEDVARQVISLVDSTIPGPTCEQWVSERYRDLASRYRARHLRDIFTGYLPAPMQVGTVSITYDSSFVTPDATALAAWKSYSVGGGAGVPAQVAGPEGFVGWYFRLFSGRVWYKIDAVDPNTGILTLTSPFSQDTNGIASGSTVANNAYYILPRYLTLDPRVRFVSTVVMDSWYREVPIRNMDWLDVNYPARWLVAFPPWICAELGTNLEATGQPKRMEFYPYPTVSTTVHYIGYKHPPYLLATDAIPPTIDDVLLVEAVLERAYRWMAFQCGNPRNKNMFNVEAAALWRNEANAQNTKWERMWPRAARNDRGTDDLTMILKSRRWQRGSSDFDPVTSARDQWLSGGPFVI